ncbi:MAG TPA: EAL domain-containing protein [Solirubrobacteraceae bacterium]|nr:EAL domain-containing protein [Solirubrobacteraceae bacterium]
MPEHSRVRLYCAAVFVGACIVVALLAGTTSLTYIRDEPLTFAVLSAGLLLGEMLPVKIPRRGNDEQITLSTPFAMALLLAGGLAPALIAQSVASVVQDLGAGKPWWRVRFNLGQYALSMSAALLTMRLFSVAPHIGSAHPFTSADLPGMIIGACAFFLVNTGVVGVAVSLYQEVPVTRYFRNDAGFVAITGAVMLLLAPIVLAATAYSVVLIPLCLAPITAIYHATWQSARSAHEARHDSLTGLPNRTAFHDAVVQAIRNERRQSCVMLIDLDRFKDVNDTLGHRYGDLLLQQVVERFRSELGHDDVLARLGGDEFAVLCTGTNRAQALLVAQRLADSLREPFELEQMVVGTQASIGVALFPADSAGIEMLLQKADVAMYRAKEKRTGVALYDERHDLHSPAKLALTVELRAALDRDEIVVWYQPVLDLRTEKVLAVEALVRWEHPQLGLLMPTSFVNMSEHTNLIKPLTQKVIELSLAQVAEWRGLGFDIAVAVNISAQVLVDDDFTERVLLALEHAQVPPSRLKLEVTESTLMAEPVVARAVLQKLDRSGVEISIDDFGTGYSSLAYLADLPVSEVKIDQSFVGRMAEGSSETIIVSSTIDLAHHLGLRAIAEGVEDVSLLPHLETLGCDAAQGYAICRPLEGEEATRWLESRTGSGVQRILHRVA